MHSVLGGVKETCDVQLKNPIVTNSNSCLGAWRYNILACSFQSVEKHRGLKGSTGAHIFLKVKGFYPLPLMMST